jgi:hypothetical protein
VVALRALVKYVKVASHRLVVFLKLPNATLTFVLIACKEIEADSGGTFVEIVAIGG